MSQAETPLWTIFLMIACTFLLTAGQVLLKTGRDPGMPLVNTFLVIGFLIYCVAGLLITFGLKHGELSILYPIISLGFVWVTLVSIFWLHESLPLHQILGTGAIIVGISIIGHKGRRR